MHLHAIVECPPILFCTIAWQCRHMGQICNLQCSLSNCLHFHISVCFLSLLFKIHNNKRKISGAIKFHSYYLISLIKCHLQSSFELISEARLATKMSNCNSWNAQMLTNVVHREFKCYIEVIWQLPSNYNKPFQSRIYSIAFLDFQLIF